MNLNPLSCQELVELVTHYLEGVMSEAARAQFEDHLSRCKGCTAYIEQMRRTIQITGKLSEETINPEAKKELLDLFRGWAKS
jgi:predicted anti-sigma-YlaC factor YlaD